jgi:inorganic pyrophosphatase/exopolyphosphatase
MRRSVSRDFTKEYAHLLDGAEGAEIAVSRKQTTIERERNKRALAAHEFLTHIPENPEELPTVTSYMPPTLKEAIFCGHLVADLDSIAGAIGAAELYGGYPARASEINSETRFAIDMWGVDVPMPIEDALQKYPLSGVCLVDHQQSSQLNKAISVERIVGVIDHHALQNSTIVTDIPIYIDIRPWGSMSTIITHSFLTHNRRPSKKTAGMLLCAILSDTLNLQGPTTTEWDRLMVTVLVEIAGVDDVQFLASQQFKAKSSELANLTADVLVNGDQKVFTFKTDKFEGSVGFAVIETTDSAVLMAKKDDLLAALKEDKEAKSLSILYLAVVNIVQLHSHLFCIGPDELDLAKVAFPLATVDSDNVVDIGNLVSRKKDFIPAVTKAIKAGWALGAPSFSEAKGEGLPKSSSCERMAVA